MTSSSSSDADRRFHLVQMYQMMHAGLNEIMRESESARDEAASQLSNSNSFAGAEIESERQQRLIGSLLSSLEKCQVVAYSLTRLLPPLHTQSDSGCDDNDGDEADSSRPPSASPDPSSAAASSPSRSAPRFLDTSATAQAHQVSHMLSSPSSALLGADPIVDVDDVGLAFGLSRRDLLNMPASSSSGTATPSRSASAAVSARQLPAFLFAAAPPPPETASLPPPPQSQQPLRDEDEDEDLPPPVAVAAATAAASAAPSEAAAGLLRENQYRIDARFAFTRLASMPSGKQEPVSPALPTVVAATTSGGTATAAATEDPETMMSQLGSWSSRIASTADNIRRLQSLIEQSP